MPLAPRFAPPPKSILWVDDEAELLEAHGIFLREKGLVVTWARNADDALAMVAAGHFDLVLLDEQMPGMRGLEVHRRLRELHPTLPVVMVTKSDADQTLRDALSADVGDYLVKPVNPRQVLAAVTKVLEGPRIRQQAVAREFVERFRALELERGRAETLDWRGWADRYDELTRWDLALAEVGEAGLQDSLRTLLPNLQREFAQFMREAYPRWLADESADRPLLSVDVVRETVMPVLAERRAVVFIVVDCLRLDQYRAIEPILTRLFDVDTRLYYSILPTATPYARNALFSGLYPADIARDFPAFWGERDDESLNAHERELLEAQLKRLGAAGPVRYQKVTTAAESEDLERHMGGAVLREGVSAFVFNFIDLLTHGRSESNVLFEVARDEVGLRRLTQQWFERSSLLSVLREAARRKVTVVLTSDHGSIHCTTPATVFAKRDATANLRYKFGEDLRAERPEQALLFTDPGVLRLPRRPGGHVHALLAANDTFFVYPTKLREYQSRYRGSFLHGGVSPEEVVLPLAVLTPRG